MQIRHLDAATLRPLGGRLLDGEAGLWRRAELVCHVLVLTTGDRILLVDTGLGTRAAQDKRKWLGSGWCRFWNPRLAPDTTVVAQLAAVGIAATDVTDIIVTHLDLDHAGGLADFPHARVHVHERELAAAHTPRSVGEKHRYRPAHFEHGPRWTTYPATGGRLWNGLAGVTAVPGLGDRVLLVPLPGHSRGHSGVAVRTEGDTWLLHAGDAYYQSTQLDLAAPQRSWGLAAFEAFGCEDAGDRRSSQHRLRRLLGSAAGRDVRMFCAHSSREYATVTTTSVGRALTPGASPTPPCPG